MNPKDKKAKVRVKRLPPKVLREIRKAFEEPLNPARRMVQSLEDIKKPENDQNQKNRFHNRSSSSGVV